jgi:hypothetical protein
VEGEQVERRGGREDLQAHEERDSPERGQVEDEARAARNVLRANPSALRSLTGANRGR